MIELYGGGSSRWVKPYWMLTELGLPFEAHAIKFQEGEHKSARIRALNPLGKLPVLKDGDFVLFEATAILNYLGEKHADAKLTPKSGTRERALYDQWQSMTVTELEQPLWRITKHTRLLPPEHRDAKDVEFAKYEFAETAKTIDALLGANSYVVGNGFTAADITLAYTLGWAKILQLLEPHRNLARYHADLTSRAGFPAKLYAR